MPAFISLIFTAILVGVTTVFAWAIWSAAAIRFARRRTLWIIVGLPMCLAGVLGGGAIIMWWSSRPQSIFEREFGFAPTADVRFLNSSTFTLGDSGSAYLHFTATPATFAKCVSGAALSPGSLNFSSNDRPSWFTPSIYRPAVYCRQDNNFATPATRPTQGFVNEVRVLQIDAASGDAWYEFVGVD